MKRVCVGIHVSEAPEQLLATLDSLRRNTDHQLPLVILADGPDRRTQESLRNLNHLTQLSHEQSLGAAACFNRLASTSDADVLVLLESGAQVGPGWLEHLLAAINADPRNGLAGPSTNNCWNEQCAYQNSGGTPHQIAATASEAARRFGSETRTLEPLYSLAEFCYVVRREVIEAVGAANESYGLGPCWEMDYNIRAARAGWRGVWAGAAYVHRSPFTARRRLEEARRFEFSKRHYQDRFCGGRLRGEKTDYRNHCRGDACPNFAPPALIELRRSWTTAPPNIAPSPLLVTDSQITTTAEPLVSCIMPTYNRRSFVPQAIRCFLRQDYPNLELVIVDDGTEPIADCLPENERIRYVRLDQKHQLGAKRNFACEQSRGQFIVHWDDDDWYPSWRVSRQMAALSDGGFDICGSSRVFFFDADKDQSWEYRYAAAGPKWVAGATLAYRKSFWERSKFPEIQIGEDSRFVWSGVSKTIHDLADPALCVAMVHSGNTSRKEVNGTSWHPQSSAGLHSLLGDDVHFYRVANHTATTAWPLVSCIMPTYNRRRFVPQALEHFRRQDYPNRELIIIDDGQDAIGDLSDGLPNVRYLHLPTRASIGAKRNLACQHAQGEIIAHWDDDDWYSSDRLRYQVAPILAGKADITGLENAFVLELPTGEFWTVNPQLHQQLFIGNVHGGTLVYRKELLAQGLRYPDINLAEDAHLLHYAMKRGKRLLRLSNPGVFVYVRHGTNAWREFAPGRFINPAGWKRIARPPIFPSSVLAACKAAAPVR
jgi:glycosyltransferase involved in cell wall biosynthesis